MWVFTTLLFSLQGCGFSTEKLFYQMVPNFQSFFYHTMQYWCPFNKYIPFPLVFEQSLYNTTDSRERKFLQSKCARNSCFSTFFIFKFLRSGQLNTRRLRFWNWVIKSEFFAPENRVSCQGRAWSHPHVFVANYFAVTMLVNRRK